MPLPQNNLAVLYMLAATGLIAIVDTTCKFYTDELHAVMLVWGCPGKQTSQPRCRLSLPGRPVVKVERACRSLARIDVIDPVRTSADDHGNQNIVINFTSGSSRHVGASRRRWG